jgi:hypothetical protein
VEFGLLPYAELSWDFSIAVAAISAPLAASFFGWTDRPPRYLMRTVLCLLLIIAVASIAAGYRRWTLQRYLQGASGQQSIAVPNAAEE